MKKKMVIIFLFLFCCFISSTCSFSSPLFISDDAFNRSSVPFYSSFGRALAEKLTPCPVNFNTKNYSVITSQCKAPKFDPEICCKSFLTFTCPFYSELNDLTNDCSATMFNHLRQYYRPRLFSESCKQCPNIGVECPDSAIPPEPAKKTAGKNSSNNSHNIRTPSILLTLTMVYGIYSILIRTIYTQ